jgi:hypothetical protein
MNRGSTTLVSEEAEESPGRSKFVTDKYKINQFIKNSQASGDKLLRKLLK